MFRAAFPSATDEAERAESLWIKASYNTAGTNKSGNARFAGTWVPPDVAHMLADSYFLAPIITPLTIAQPDPNVVYRKGQKGTQQPTPVATPTAHTPASPAQSITETPPVKRRREGSPATPARSQIPTATQSTPRRGATPQRLSATPGSPRRSTRLASPAPTLPTNIVSSATKVTRVLHESVGPFGSDETIVEEDTTEIHKVAEQNMEEDIREQKELINRLKAEKAELAAREAVKKARASTEERSTAESAGAAPVKRAREDEAAPLTLDIKEPEAGERAIASNRRVRLLGNMRPEQKSLAWGAFLFAAGMGAVYVHLIYLQICGSLMLIAGHCFHHCPPFSKEPTYSMLLHRNPVLSHDALKTIISFPSNATISRATIDPC